MLLTSAERLNSCYNVSVNTSQADMREDLIMNHSVDSGYDEIGPPTHTLLSTSFTVTTQIIESCVLARAENSWGDFLSSLFLTRSLCTENSCARAIPTMFMRFNVVRFSHARIYWFYEWSSFKMRGRHVVVVIAHLNMYGLIRCMENTCPRKTFYSLLKPIWNYLVNNRFIALIHYFVTPFCPSEFNQW